jgi:hypothetical protein
VTSVSHVTLPQAEGGNVAGDDARISDGGAAAAVVAIAVGAAFVAVGVTAVDGGGSGEEIRSPSDWWCAPCK